MAKFLQVTICCGLITSSTFRGSSKKSECKAHVQEKYYLAEISLVEKFGGSWTLVHCYVLLEITAISWMDVVIIYIWWRLHSTPTYICNSTVWTMRRGRLSYQRSKSFYSPRENTNKKIYVVKKNGDCWSEQHQAIWPQHTTVISLLTFINRNEID